MKRKSRRSAIARYDWLAQQSERVLGVCHALAQRDYLVLGLVVAQGQALSVTITPPEQTADFSDVGETIADGYASYRGTLSPYSDVSILWHVYVPAISRRPARHHREDATP